MALLKFTEPVRDAHDITVEDCPPRADGAAQCRWVCACGEVGIPVGSPCFEAREWASLAGWFHAGVARANSE